MTDLVKSRIWSEMNERAFLFSVVALPMSGIFPTLQPITLNISCDVWVALTFGSSGTVLMASITRYTALANFSALTLSAWLVKSIENTSFTSDDRAIFFGPVKVKVPLAAVSFLLSTSLAVLFPSLVMDRIEAPFGTPVVCATCIPSTSFATFGSGLVNRTIWPLEGLFGSLSTLIVPLIGREPARGCCLT